MALSFGLILAFMTLNGAYIMGLYELIIGVIIGHCLILLVRWGNYTNYAGRIFILIGIVLGIYFFNQYFQYLFAVDDTGEYAVNFIEFISNRVREGLTINSINYGSSGLLISWVLQLAITYVFA